MNEARLPGGLHFNRRLSQWLRFRPEGVVEVRSGKVELGQGILTALAQLVAHELEVSIDRVRMLPASTAASPNEGVTSGSASIQDSGLALRYACAEARALFLVSAAARLGVDPGSIRVCDGELRAATKGTSYWALCEAVDLDREATASIAPRPAQADGMGARAARIDLPDKVLGRPCYVHDLEPPGLLHGRVLRPPSPEATLVSLDEAAARAIAGVAGVVRDGRFVGVIAEREETALKAIEALRRGAHWREEASLPVQSPLAEWLRAQPVETTLIEEKPSASASPVAATRRARFSRPFLAHASIGPSCALAQWSDGELRVWSHTQGIFNLRADLALVFGMAPERIVVEHVAGAGCYGHNGADDVALDAALLARAAGGRPVKVVWSRAEELAWAPFGPAMAVEIEADLDGAGEVLAWRGDVWSNGHGTRPGRAKTPSLLAASHLAKPFERLVAVNAPLATGGGSERNAVPPYGFPAHRVRNHRLLAMPVRASALRSLGAAANVFAIEGFVDDVAVARGEDPVAWRLRHLADPRARAVIEAAARRAGWSARPAREGAGRGIGYARYKGTGAYCAVVAEVEAEREIRVRRLVIAVDVGLAVNVDGVANQIEGGAIQATSWTLKEAVRFDSTRITSDSWEAYPILRFSEVPEVEVEVLQRREEPSRGAGEAAMGPTVAAIANAVVDALGVRVRDLPITAAAINAAGQVS